MPDASGSPSAAGETAACRSLKDVWGGFVDSFVSSLHAGGRPALVPRVQIASTDLSPPVTVLKPVQRLVAIGDLHGDMEKTLRAFRLGGLIDASDRWSGGATTVVQVGDQLDRGGNEVEILYLLERLRKEAAEAGGQLIVMNGNHETMNVAGRFRYATQSGIREFQMWHLRQLLGASLKDRCGIAPGICSVPSLETPALEKVPASSRPRAAALAPGSPFSLRFLSAQPTVLKVGSTVFVHGGLMPEHLKGGLERLNRDTSTWISGRGEQPHWLNGPRGVVWSRLFSERDPAKCDCALLQETLRKASASRLVMGHTIQTQGINSVCGDTAIRIDVGMSAGCIDAEPQVLEIVKDREMFVLRYDANGEVVRTEVPRAVRMPEQETHRGAPDQPPARVAKKAQVR